MSGSCVGHAVDPEISDRGAVVLDAREGRPWLVEATELVACVSGADASLGVEVEGQDMTGEVFLGYFR